MRILSIALLLSIFMSGCALLNKYSMHNHSEFELEESDIRKIHDFNWMTECYEKRIELGDEQIKEIEKHGINITSDDRLINYIRVIREKSGGSIGGNIFVIKGTGEFSHYELLVCIHNGLINEIYVRNNPKNEKRNEVINKDFLNQFIGRTLEQSFELRENTEDLVVTPIKLAGIRNAPAISKDIALKLKKVLAIARALKL